MPAYMYACFLFWLAFGGGNAGTGDLLMPGGSAAGNVLMLEEPPEEQLMGETEADTAPVSEPGKNHKILISLFFSLGGGGVCTRRLNSLLRILKTPIAHRPPD